MLRLISFLLFSISYVLITGDSNIFHALLAGAIAFVTACTVLLALTAIAIMWIFQRGDAEQKKKLLEILEE